MKIVPRDQLHTVLGVRKLSTKLRVAQHYAFVLPVRRNVKRINNPIAAACRECRAAAGPIVWRGAGVPAGLWGIWRLWGLCGPD